MKLFLSLILISILNHATQAQNVKTATIEWKGLDSSSATVLKSLPSREIITSSPTKIEWKQSDGTIKYSLSVRSIRGSWNDVNINGQLVFEVDREGKRGTVLFNKDAFGTKIKFILMTDQAPYIHELEVTNVQAL